MQSFQNTQSANINGNLIEIDKVAGCSEDPCQTMKSLSSFGKLWNCIEGNILANFVDLSFNFSNLSFLQESWQQPDKVSMFVFAVGCKCNTWRL